MFFGMFGVGLFGLIVTPAFHVAIRGLVAWLNRGAAGTAADHATHAGGGHAAGHGSVQGGGMPVPTPQPARGPEDLADSGRLVIHDCEQSARKRREPVEKSNPLRVREGTRVSTDGRWRYQEGLGLDNALTGMLSLWEWRSGIMQCRWGL